ncbi:MAG: EVE domain-containing protein, partial [Deltaproteobacteria bacterium]|nr:EVE domain-containing protein [Deltaproteobacteria bacterium]
MACWLVKTEPETYAFETLERDGRACWDLVRNYLARNNLRAMRVGEQAFVYHSVGPKEIVGICEIVREHYPDPKATDEGEPPDRWSAVDVKPVQRLPRPVSLDELKAHPILYKMELIRQSRLSVCPVTDEQWAAVLALADAEPPPTKPTKPTKPLATKPTKPTKPATKQPKPATKQKATKQKATKQ